MRMIFSSPRLDNVDRVVALLRIAGIEPMVSNRRRWSEGYDRNHMPYSDGQTKKDWPQVMVHADDIARARDILREANLLPGTRMPGSDYIPSEPPLAGRGEGRLRLWLLAACMVGAGLVFLRLFGFP